VQNRANQVLDAARGFARHLEETDRSLRRTATTVLSRQVKDEVASRF
jgi:hypothetical protein